MPALGSDLIQNAEIANTAAQNSRPNLNRFAPEEKIYPDAPSRTVSIINFTFSGSASGVIPCPKLKI